MNEIPTFQNYKVVKHVWKRNQHGRPMVYRWYVFKHVDGRSILFIDSFNTLREAIDSASNHQGITDCLRRG